MRPLFESAVAGYADAARGFLEPEEWGAIPEGTVTITVELAARFCADALRESYFRWDERRYASASAHNQARTRGQLQIAEEPARRAARAARDHGPRVRLGARESRVSFSRAKRPGGAGSSARRDTAVTNRGGPRRRLCGR